MLLDYGAAVIVECAVLTVVACIHSSRLNKPASEPVGVLPSFGSTYWGFSGLLPRRCFSPYSLLYSATMFRTNGALQIPKKWAVSLRHDMEHSIAVFYGVD